MKDILKLAATLFIVCSLAAGSLAFVNAATKDKIAEYALVAQQDALAKVAPGATEFTEIVSGESWDAIKDGVKAGSVYLAATQGYSGPINVMFGVGPDGAITGARVVLQTETPGLGAKITGDKFIGQFTGKKASEVALKKDDPSNGQIDAISAATISSRAVTKAVRAALDAAGGGN